MPLNRPLFACILALFASAILSFTDNFVHAVQQTAGLWQFQLVKASIALPILLAAAYWKNISCRPVHVGRWAIRSVTIAVSFLIYFATLGFLPVAQAGAGLYSAPIWIMLFSVIFLGKHIGIRRILAMIIGFSGVLALLQPDINNLTLLSAIPLLAGAFYGLGGIATKLLCQDENPVVLAIGVFTAIAVIAAGLLLYFTLFPSPAESVAFHSRGWEDLSARFLWLTLGQAIGAALAIALLANAYRFGEPDFVSVCEYSFLIFAAIWALVLWSIPTNLMAQFGILTIILSGVWMYFLDRQPEPSRSKHS
ncbi:DMT family transporter [Cognatishimia sp. 1_MG-2023]|uniref:DMT family transporter n=1 Tax=Cognatishimia sp. 1_MG-2023 TaxID=3062642 RepID=UPI0026E149E0|nr:DMT family transporter [Cognatishimia sp. 1_MG-2023]MDO6728215.1 DMT family transporter [Cognatishimia sp. 1_MG-2023]